MDDSRDYGAQLRSERTRAGVSIGELAQALGVGVAFLSGVERGREPPLTHDQTVQAACLIGAEAEPLTALASKHRLRVCALDLFKPPFRFDVQGGCIWGARNEFVLDELGCTGYMMRLRNWGRISYLPDPEQLQDQAGHLVAEALTRFWTEETRGRD